MSFPLALTGSVGDPSRTRTVYAAILFLIALGVGLIIVAIWLFRSTRSDPPVLAPLERMGERGWRKADPVWQRRQLDDLRPPGAEPLVTSAPLPSHDAAFDLGPQAPGFDDLRSDAAAAAAAAAAAIPLVPDAGAAADVPDPAADQPSEEVLVVGASQDASVEVVGGASHDASVDESEEDSVVVGASQGASEGASGEVAAVDASQDASEEVPVGASQDALVDGSEEVAGAASQDALVDGSEEVAGAASQDGSEEVSVVGASQDASNGPAPVVTSDDTTDGVLQFPEPSVPRIDTLGSHGDDDRPPVGSG